MTPFMQEMSFIGLIAIGILALILGLYAVQEKPRFWQGYIAVGLAIFALMPAIWVLMIWYFKWAARTA
jgi:ABC-type dipeptide/oligopeptide/nickel transport system permease component